MQAGVLVKVPYSEHPPRHDYRLTDKGRDLWPVLTTMRQWGDKYAAPDGPPLELIHERLRRDLRGAHDLLDLRRADRSQRRPGDTGARRGRAPAAHGVGGQTVSAQSSSVGRFPFAEISALAAAGPSRFDADVNPEWTIAGKPNGGYLLAMLGRAAASVGAHAHVIAASAHYLHAPIPGPVVIEAELLRGGRSASQVRARMSQDGEACVEALLTTSQLEAAVAPYWERGLPPISHVAYHECARLVPRTPDGSRVAIMDQIEVRLEPDSSGFTTGRPSGRGELRGWLALPEDEAFDPPRCCSPSTPSRPPRSTSSSQAGCRRWS